MASNTFPTIISACTAQQAPSSRLSFWDRYSTESLIGLRTSSSLSTDFFARLSGCSLEELKIFEIEGSVHCVERNGGIVEEFPKRSIFSCHLTRGSAYFVQKGRVVELNAGDTIIYNANEPFTYGFATPMRQFLVDLPVSLAENQWGIDIDALPIKLSSKAPIEIALRSELCRSLSQIFRSPPSEFTASFAEQTNYLLKSLVHAKAREAYDLHRSIFYVVDAKKFILENLSSPNLDLSSVALHVGLSSRHLGRLFRSEGYSISEYIWTKRAEKARRDLTDVSMSHLSIYEIAFRCGYSSSAHFTRAMVERFKATPSSIRRSFL